MLINIVILRINHAIFIIERKKTKQRVLMKRFDKIEQWFIASLDLYLTIPIMQNKIQQILNKNRQVTTKFHY